MKVEIQHSIVQDMTVIKFNSLKDYFRCLEFMQIKNLQWTPLTYSSAKDSASIRVNESVLNKVTKRFSIGKMNEEKKHNYGI